MTPEQRRLRELLDRQSRERGRMAEIAAVDELSDEQRSEIDTIERGTPDLERQIRAARIAVDDDQAAAETRAVNEPELDDQAINGNGTAPNLAGYFPEVDRSEKSGCCRL